MCLIFDTQHCCKHWSRRVASPCPSARKVAVYADPTKTFWSPCHNQEVTASQASREECSICKRKNVGKGLLYHVDEVIWNDRYLDVQEERGQIHEQVQWFLADGTPAEEIDNR